MVFLLNDRTADDHSSTYKINDPDLHDDKWEYLISRQILRYNNSFTYTDLTSFPQFLKHVPIFEEGALRLKCVTWFQLCRAVSTVWMAN